MGLQPSRPAFLVAGAIVFLALPFLWGSVSHEPLSLRLVGLGIAMAVVFLALAAQYRRQRRAQADGSPAA
ncbi:MAG: hypothetical protein HOQ11_02590 [Gemmatimonadaceae bacterium]|nr:hypothetical protein [Gemmatimonadaceae bacterium]NUQ92532.1 hypothetical protein [Gemmatimonadaceae bacterium]NUR32740.1 hypothetical protein [Gemmatimonadaceae bacterium]NUS96276.1 hypothetical protein [Gemmatimonadaceae bacterium]